MIDCVDYDLLDFLQYHIHKEEQILLETDIKLSKVKPKSSQALGLVDSASYHEGLLNAFEKVYNKVRFNEE